MPYNGSGAASAPGANYPAVAATLITAANRNAVDADIYTCLSTAITKDGQTTVTANLPMSGFKLTGVGAATARTDAATLATIQDGTGVYVSTVGGTADVITLTLSPAITAYVAGQTFRFIASGANTTNVTVNVNALGAKAITKNGTTALIAGDLPSGSIVEIVYDGTRFVLTGTSSVSAVTALNTAVTARIDVAHNTDGTVKSGTILVGGGGQGAYATYSSGVFTLYGAPRGHIHGLTLSTAGSSATMSIATGLCTDSTYTLPMFLTGTLAKTTSAWAVGTGNGGLDTGSIANSTWYHWYLIYRSDTGVVDALCSTSASAPTMPANYTHKRRIGAGRTNGSAQWTSFIQDGDLFQWLVPLNEASANNPGASAVTLGLIVPTGVNVEWIGSAGIVNTDGTETALLVTDLGTTDTAPSTGNLHQVAVGNITGNQRSASFLRVRTDTTGQIRYRLSASNGNTTVLINTIGWLDRRGREA
jgi:hypothetical protein